MTHKVTATNHVAPAQAKFTIPSLVPEKEHVNCVFKNENLWASDSQGKTIPLANIPAPKAVADGSADAPKATKGFVIPSLIPAPVKKNEVAWTSKRPQPAVDPQYSGKQNYGDTYTVKKGNTAWDVAKSGLQSKGVKTTNAHIMKEINRLAQINGCKNGDELAKKFHIGSTIKIEGYSPEVKHHAVAKNPPQTPYSQSLFTPPTK